MRSNIVAREILFALLVLYRLLNCVFTEGSVFSQASIVLIILISFVYFFKTLLLNESFSLFFIAWTVFVVLNIVGFLFNPHFAAGTARDTFKNILGCMLPFYPFYYFTRKNILSAKILLRFFMMMIPVLILQFILNRNNVLIELDTFDTDIVNNMGYAFVSLMPFVFLIKKRKLLSGLLMGIFILFIIQSAKRGALIAGSLGMIIYFYYLIRTVDRAKKAYSYVLVFIVFLALGYFAWKTYSGNEFLLTRLTMMMDGDTSNRSVLYTTILSEWYNSNNLWHLFFGFGFGGSLILTSGNLAHCDWLELLASFGFVGIMAYVFLLSTAVGQVFKSDWQADKRLLMMTLTVIWLFVSLISMWYLSFIYSSFAILFAYLNGSDKPFLV